MSESYESPSDPLGGPIPRPDGDGLPPVDGRPRPPGRGESVDPGAPDERGDTGRDAGGMLAAP